MSAPPPDDCRVPRVLPRRLAISIERLWHDCRHAFRLIARAPGFAAIAVISIAFGTGANVAIFSTADALLLRPLPVDRWSELVTVGTHVRREVSLFTVSSYPDYVDVRDRARSFTGLAAFTQIFMGFRAGPVAPPQVRLGTVVSSNYFRVLGVELERGRSFTADEDQEGQPPTVVIGHAMWQTMFVGDANVIGQTLRVSGIDCTIVGVAPASFWGLNQRYIPETAFLPIGLWPRLANTPGVNPLTARDRDLLNVKGHLRAGVTLAEARSELDVIAADLAREYPATNAHQRLSADTELQVKMDADPFTTGALLLLGILSIAVLAVGCANVAGLLASRVPVRSREIALRLAIGAGRGRVFRQLMTESLVIALVGAAGGIAVGYAGVALLGQIRYPSEVIGMPRAMIDERALSVALLLAMASAIFFGVVPAWQATRTNLIAPLKAGDAAPGRLRLTGRHFLVALQVALSLVLVTIAVFTSQAFQRIFGEGPGFRTERMAKFTVAPEQTGYREADLATFFDRVLTDARQLAGAQSVAVASAMPLFSFETVAIAPEGEPSSADHSRPTTVSNRVDEQYFMTMGIPLIAGRAVLSSDTAATPPVAVVNDTLAAFYWPGESALGKRFRVTDAADRWVEVVGVVRTSQYWFAGERPQRAVYFPFRQRPAGRMSLLAATTADSASLLSPIREVIRKLDPDVPVYDAQTIEHYYDARTTSFGNVLLRLVGGMGLMGMTLTITGLYGLVSYGASRRTREIGIRIALGASARRVRSMILRQGMWPAWMGLIAGGALSLATAEFLAGRVPIAFVYRPATLAIIVPIIVAVSVVAAFVPARRASNVAPTVALRCE